MQLSHTTSAAPQTIARPRSLWRNRDFVRLWAGQTISQLGSTVTREALPYTAILALHATPFQMGLLGAAGTAPLLLLGLLAGVWVDRLRRRPLMIAADLGRALLLLSIPAAFLLGQLRMGQLYAVAALAGALTVFFDVAYQSYLPALVKRDQIVEGNSKLGVSSSLAEIGGPPLGGVLVQLISGPITVLLDAVSFLYSAFALLRIRADEPPPAPVASRQRIWADLAEGLRAMWADDLLRPLAVGTAIRNFFGWFFGAIYSLYAIETLGLGTAALGLTVACGGIGALLGALAVGPLTRRLGFGTATVAALLVRVAASSLIWLAGATPQFALMMLVASQLVGDMAMTVALINETSLRQTVAPPRLLGRVNASARVLGEGVGTLGMLAGGALAVVIGLRATVAVAVLGALVGDLWVAGSPLRRLRALRDVV